MELMLLLLEKIILFKNNFRINSKYLSFYRQTLYLVEQIIVAYFRVKYPWKIHVILKNSYNSKRTIK